METKINILSIDELDKLFSLMTMVRTIIGAEEQLIYREMMSKGSDIMYCLPIQVILNNDEFKEYHPRANDALNRVSLLIAQNTELIKIFTK